jgi:hypothetical protein
MARTTAREKGAELVFALIIAAKERLNVGENMQVLPSARAKVSSCNARATCTTNPSASCTQLALKQL